jgi:uncharacterized protein YunC (DUF1805 family)
VRTLERNKNMIDIAPLTIGDKTALGLRVDLPDSPPFLLIICKTGLIGCGFVNIEAAERLNVPAAMVTGVKTLDEVLDAEVKAATSKAQVKGVQIGMKGKDAVRVFL